MFDPKKMAFGALKNVALKKMGLGWLNPYLGIASLLGFDLGSLTSKFAKKPAFDIEEASELGLHANRYPTDEGGQFPTNEQYADSTIAEKIATGKVDLAKLIKGEDTGLKSDVSPEYQGLVKQASLKDMSVYQIKDFKALDLRDKMEKSGLEIPDPLNDEEKQRLEKLRKLKESKVLSSTGPVMVAHGGRVDRPLMGRSRDI